jgi:hypothetical protein
MENDPTLPAMLTQPDTLGAPSDASSGAGPGLPVFKLIFLGVLLALVAIAYFV